MFWIVEIVTSHFKPIRAEFHHRSELVSIKQSVFDLNCQSSRRCQIPHHKSQRWTAEPVDWRRDHVDGEHFADIPEFLEDGMICQSRRQVLGGQYTVLGLEGVRGLVTSQPRCQLQDQGGCRFCGREPKINCLTNYPYHFTPSSYRPVHCW